MLVKYIIYGIVIYILYKFIFELVIPVSKATTQVKDKLREMQEQQARQQQQQEQPRAEQQPTNTAPKSSSDYIDFEEIK